MTKITTAIEKSNTTNEVSQFIQQAIEKNLPVDVMERLFTLRERVKAEQGKEAFTAALAEFQKQCPIIKKDKKVFNKDGRTLRYMYAPIESVIKQIRSGLANNGFSYSWDVEQIENSMKVTAKLTHVFGHFETSSITMPIEKSDYMNAPQSYATAQTYAKRYTLLNVLGIGTADEDTDANTFTKEKNAKSEKSRIAFALRTLGYETDNWSKEEWESEISKLADLKLEPKNFKEIVARLEVLVKEKQENENK